MLIQFQKYLYYLLIIYLLSFNQELDLDHLLALVNYLSRFQLKQIMMAKFYPNKKPIIFHILSKVFAILPKYMSFEDQFVQIEIIVN